MSINVLIFFIGNILFDFKHLIPDMLVSNRWIASEKGKAMLFGLVGASVVVSDQSVAEARTLAPLIPQLLDAYEYESDSQS